MRVLPLLELKHLPLTPDVEAGRLGLHGAPVPVIDLSRLAGLMDLHGVPVPVIDLSRLAGLPPAAAQFDTRIVIVDYHAPGGDTHELGLLASQVRGIADIAREKLEDSGVATAPFLGQVASDADGIVQLVELAHLLPPDVRALLCQGGSAA